MVSDREPPRSSGTQPAHVSRPRVLVIDDELLVAQSLRLVLSAEFDVAVTTQPREALAWIASGESYDVILCDVMMPELNGVQLRERIAALDSEQAARVVFITGGLLLPEVRLLLDRVPNTCLEKPLDLDGLRELIRRRVRGESWRPAGRAV
jgi:CheY-like chemotaxis protein